MYKRQIQNHLEDGLSELIVAEELQPGDTVNVSVDKEKEVRKKWKMPI